MSRRTFRRGEVYWVEFSFSRGGEIQKTRPAIIISNDTANRYMNRVQVIPLTLSVHRMYPGDALVTVDGTQNKAMASQIGTATKERVKSYVATLSEDDIHAVEDAIREQLALPR
jgi:mRNA interferase MazF